MEMFDDQLWTKNKTELQHIYASYIGEGQSALLLPPPSPNSLQARVVQKTDSAIQRINHYPVDMY